MGNAASTSVQVGDRLALINQQIGAGGFASVYAGIDSATGQSVVLKRQRVERDNRDGVATLEMDVQVSKEVSRSPHACVIRVLGATQRETDGYEEADILMERATGGSAFDMLRAREGRGEPLTEGEVARVVHDLASGTAHLHTLGYTHRDIKLENILLVEPLGMNSSNTSSSSTAGGSHTRGFSDDRSMLSAAATAAAVPPAASVAVHKLCDFGSCVRSPVVLSNEADVAEQESLIERTTTLHYRAPELCDLRSVPADVHGKRQLTHASDVWAIGVTVYKLCFMRFPFDDGAGGASRLSILNGRFALPPPTRWWPRGTCPYSPALLDIIRACLQVDASNRPTAADVARMARALPAWTAAPVAAMPADGVPPVVVFAHQSRSRAGSGSGSDAEGGRSRSGSLTMQHNHSNSSGSSGGGIPGASLAGAIRGAATAAAVVGRSALTTAVSATATALSGIAAAADAKLAEHAATRLMQLRVGDDGSERNVIKATSLDHPGPPKGKYVRRVVLQAWEAASASPPRDIAVVTYLPARPLDTQPIVACKAAVLLYRLWHQGPPACVRATAPLLSVLQKAEAAVHAPPASDGLAFEAFVARLLHCTVAKLQFHNPSLAGSLSAAPSVFAADGRYGSHGTAAALPALLSQAASADAPAFTAALTSMISLLDSEIALLESVAVVQGVKAALQQSRPLPRPQANGRISGAGATSAAESASSIEAACQEAAEQLPAGVLCAVGAIPALVADTLALYTVTVASLLHLQNTKGSSALPAPAAIQRIRTCTARLQAAYAFVGRVYAHPILRHVPDALEVTPSLPPPGQDPLASGSNGSGSMSVMDFLAIVQPRGQAEQVGSAPPVWDETPAPDAAPTAAVASAPPAAADFSPFSPAAAKPAMPPRHPVTSAQPANSRASTPIVSSSAITGSGSGSGSGPQHFVDPGPVRDVTAAVRAIGAVKTNHFCAECKDRGPTWASINLGVLVCHRCSGLHRGLGTHISQVRSLTLDTWQPAWARTVLAIGNARAAAYWEARVAAVGAARPNASSSMAEVEAWVRAKYERRAFAPPGAAAPHEQLAAAIAAGASSKPGSAADSRATSGASSRASADFDFSTFGSFDAFGNTTATPSAPLASAASTPAVTPVPSSSEFDFDPSAGSFGNSDGSEFGAAAASSAGGGWADEAVGLAWAHDDDDNRKPEANALPNTLSSTRATAADEADLLGLGAPSGAAAAAPAAPAAADDGWGTVDSSFAFGGAASGTTAAALPNGSNNQSAQARGGAGSMPADPFAF